MLRAEDSAQNVVETWVLAVFSVAIAGAAAWLALARVLPWPVAAAVLAPATLVLIALASALSAALAAAWQRLGLAPFAWPLLRATEEVFLLGQTAASVALAATGPPALAALGGLWLVLAAVNFLAAVGFRLLERRRR
jgi:hypothetical protein